MDVRAGGVSLTDDVPRPMTLWCFYPQVVIELGTLHSRPAPPNSGISADRDRQWSATNAVTCSSIPG